MNTAKNFTRCAHSDEEVKAVNELARYKIGWEVIILYDTPEYEDNCFDDVMYRVTYETGRIFDEESNPGHPGFNLAHKRAIHRWVQKYEHLCTTQFCLQGWAPGQWGA